MIIIDAYRLKVKYNFNTIVCFNAKQNLVQGKHIDTSKIATGFDSKWHRVQYPKTDGAYLKINIPAASSNKCTYQMRDIKLFIYRAEIFHTNLSHATIKFCLFSCLCK